MEKTYTSTQKFLRMSPKKIRVVVAAVKKMKPEQAVEVLPYMEKRAAMPLQKTIKSAIANAKMQGAEGSTLVFKEIVVNEGPRLRRGRAASKGRYHPIKKKMAHIRIVLQTKVDVKPAKVEAKPEVKEIKKIEKKTTKKGAKGGTES